MGFFCVDVETCPVDREEWLKLGEEERKRLLNPIDSRIVAIGVKEEGKEAVVLLDESEKKMLEEFWGMLAEFKKSGYAGKIVGFNLKNFDLPVLVTRSFIHNVRVVPFLLKEIVDLRESLSVFKYGHVRGKLKEYAAFIGIKAMDGMDGSKVAEACWKGETKKIAEYLKKDLEITEEIYKRAKSLRITEIQRW
ncbi:MAG: ribonuclease H-like domain-containing protein [Candidatus Diapherotrites archaeon]|nr:ribonuclease H-like domain-containing protein [Candidatus Diapherotrites archaeon]